MADAAYMLITGDLVDIEMNCVVMKPAVGGISVVKQTIQKTEVPGNPPQGSRLHVFTQDSIAVSSPLLVLPLLSFLICVISISTVIA